MKDRLAAGAVFLAAPPRSPKRPGTGRVCNRPNDRATGLEAGIEAVRETCGSGDVLERRPSAGGARRDAVVPSGTMLAGRPVSGAGQEANVRTGA